MPRLTNGFMLAGLLLWAGCGRNQREDLSYDYNVLQTWTLNDNEGMGGIEIVQFESVAYLPEETTELRRLIVSENVADGRATLEISTGTGMLAMLCELHGATSVLATDRNPAAVACARYNAAKERLDEQLEVRQADAAPANAYAAIKDDEKFDLIIAHPPSADQPVEAPADYAFNDPQYQLLQSLLDGLPQHLNPAGRCLLSYRHREALEKIKQIATERGWSFNVLDERKLEDLPDEFLRGVVVEIKLPITKVDPSGR
ncbi:50S ribosomal protein L11 methyltransferase [Roseimaritima ulvae]|uniref:Ribosomal protein L11 methyltransferase n=1 Tax=Roseimaritima ulvae TaxID=980254 RepID=A0A5B9R0K6_9BACT|nr:50S ribosomal protein L11 methyltransferase [Roseimaritima ulvae]QEG39791.1 ribosomal protein L11 methyltransferase [Roseimaritima ulvae]